MLKTLDHQNIINIFEFYEGDYNFYIVTEYCQSGNLADRINKTNSINKKICFEIINNKSNDSFRFKIKT